MLYPRDRARGGREKPAALYYRSATRVFPLIKAHQEQWWCALNRIFRVIPPKSSAAVNMAGALRRGMLRTARFSQFVSKF